MVFSEGFVVSLKVNGKYLRDNDSCINLPFGSEYSLYLKNMKSVDAVVRVSIDGHNVTEGKWIIVRGNSFVELDGFLENNIAKNKFKFIELTKEIEEYRGHYPEDSLIKVEVRFVQEVSITYTPVVPYYIYYDWSWGRTVSGGSSGNPITINTYCSNTSSASNTVASSNYVAESSQSTFSDSDLGITVKGSETNQPFQEGYIGTLENKVHTIVLKLSGYRNYKKEKIETIITTREKIKCPTCGNKNDSFHKFCSNCGTYLR